MTKQFLMQFLVFILNDKYLVLGDQQPTPRSVMYHDDSDTEDDSGEPVSKRSRCDEEDNGNESSDDDMHDNEMEYIFFGVLMKSLKLTKMNGCLKVQYTKIYITKYITFNQ
jgi:hypothetical protein